MVVSEEYKYAFIQLPHTACTAVGHELVENYGGRPILSKHASYRAFRTWAGDEADDYFVFASIRNPMDEVVSIYHKFKNDHNGDYSNPANWRQNGGWLSRRGLRQFLYVKENGASFQDYFRRFFVLPYVNTSVLVHGRMNALLRFEDIQNDFAQVVQRLGLDFVRDLPHVNPTDKQGKSFEMYYEGMEAHARRVFGPLNQLWGYDFPSGWSQEVPLASGIAFSFSRAGKTAFWTFSR